MRDKTQVFEVWLEGNDGDPAQIAVTSPYINNYAEEDAAELHLKDLIDYDPDYAQYALMNSPVTVHVRDLNGNVTKVSVDAEVEMVYWPRKEETT